MSKYPHCCPPVVSPPGRVLTLHSVAVTSPLKNQLTDRLRLELGLFIYSPTQLWVIEYRQLQISKRFLYLLIPRFFQPSRRFCGYLASGFSSCYHLLLCGDVSGYLLILTSDATTPHNFRESRASLIMPLSARSFGTDPLYCTCSIQKRHS